MPIPRETKSSKSLRNDNVVATNVSDATRSMAQPPTHEVRTFSQEYDALLEQKRELERQLSHYSKTTFLKEQQRIRRECGYNHQKGLSQWIDKKSAQKRNEQS